MDTHSSTLSVAYFRFLQLRRSLSEFGETPLSANQRALLDTVVLAWHEGKPMSVREAIAQRELGSPATLHKRLTVLRRNGLLSEVFHQNDRRTKLLAPTEKALAQFEALGRAMLVPQV